VIEASFGASTTGESDANWVRIVDSLAVGQSIEGGADERVILFVKLPAGESLSKKAEEMLELEIRRKRSPRHVPAKVGLVLR
jgi:acyl-coenzyme A synthetase/AMP-(fatty) acid ligase